MESIDGKFKNLKITIQNDKCQEQSSSINKGNRSTKELINNLKMLQTGKLTSESVMKIKNIPDLVTPKMKKKKDNKKRDEILELNRKIQEKINSKIKPMLESILNKKQPMNGFMERKALSSSSQDLQSLPRIKILSKDEIVNIPKTKISSVDGNEVEIYRYSFHQLYALQQCSTWEIVPRLLKLNICQTNLQPLDEFVMTLLEMNNDERNDAILKKAQERKFIQRKAENVFEYLRPEFSSNNQVVPKIVEEKSEKSSKTFDEKQKKSLDYVDRFRLVANNDEHLNSLIYHHEFLSLFKNELKDYDLTDLESVDVVKLLLDNNQAYVLEGEIRINQRNYQEAYVTHKKGMRDVCINTIVLRKHAFHGDFVKVLVKKDSSSEDDLEPSNNQLDESTEAVLDEEVVQVSPDDRNFGCVLEILEKRHPRRVIGSFAPFVNVKKNRKHLMVNVRDPKVPNVRVNIKNGIPTGVEFNEKLLLTVEIVGWSHDQPLGKILSTIGNKGQLKTENVAILLQNNLNPVPFEQNIIDQLPKEPFEIPQKEFEYREDLRKKCIFSIDPETARDLDDALSCEVLENGNLEVGVHISDVSYFVKENSDLDNIVKEKATTIYLVDTVYHMLPEQLCLLCSLLPGSDKMVSNGF